MKGEGRGIRKIIAEWFRKADAMLIDRNWMVEAIKAVNSLIYDLVIVPYR